MKAEHTLAILVRNTPGVLTKIASVFYRHNYNIESLTVGKMPDNGLSKIIISLPVDDRDIELLRRQIENLVDVQYAQLLDRNQSTVLEVCLMRLIYHNARERRGIMATAEPYQPRIRQVSNVSITLEVSETPELIDDFVSAMKGQYEIVDISRSGMTAMGPGLPPLKRDENSRGTIIQALPEDLMVIHGRSQL